MLNRIFLIAGIVFLIPFIDQTIHHELQDPSEPVPRRILNLLRSPSQTQNIRGFVELASFRGDWSNAIDLIEGGLKSKSERLGVRQATVYALSHADPRFLKHVEPRLKSEDYLVYATGCDMALAVGESTGKFVDLVRVNINEPSHDEKAKGLPPDPMRGPDDFQFRFTMASLLALRGMGPKARPALDKVIECLDPENLPYRSPSKKTQVVMFACRVIIAMGPEGKPAAEKLVWIVKNGDAQTKGLAAMALAQTGPNDKIDSVATIAPLLESFNTVVRDRALDAIAEFGPEAKSHLPLLKELMTSRRLHTQPYGAYAYCKVSGEFDGPVAVLAKLTTELNTREQAVELIGRLGPPAAAATDALIEVLESVGDDEILLREKAVISLGQIGPDAKAALPALDTLIKKELDWLLRARALEAVAKIKSQ